MHLVRVVVQFDEMTFSGFLANAKSNEPMSHFDKVFELYLSIFFYLIIFPWEYSKKGSFLHSFSMFLNIPKVFQALLPSLTYLLQKNHFVYKIFIYCLLFISVSKFALRHVMDLETLAPQTPLP